LGLGFHEALGTATFKKGDGPLDEMLEDARGKFLSRDIEVRRESLERLWDAWESLRTLEQGKDRRRRLKPRSIMSQESRPSRRPPRIE
jgi:hypothetical protein